MKKREELQDCYEDALFALLMDEISTIDGKQAEAENERLKNDPTAEVPVEVDRRCMQTIRRHFAMQKAHAAGRFTVRAMKRIAMAAGIAAILFTTAFASSETVRVNTLNVIIEVFETNTEFRFSSADTEEPLKLDVGWVPEGYTLVDQGSNELEIWYDYQNEEGDWLTINCKKTDGLVTGIDTEDAEVEYIQIESTEAMLVNKGIVRQLIWSPNNNTVAVGIVGSNIGREDILRIANELCY